MVINQPDVVWTNQKWQLLIKYGNKLTMCGKSIKVGKKTGIIWCEQNLLFFPLRSRLYERFQPVCIFTRAENWIDYMDYSWVGLNRFTVCMLKQAEYL